MAGDVSLLLQEVANGLMIGGAYALIAIGFTLVFGVARILNLAHPDIFMVGAYVAMLALRAMPGNLALALLLAMLGSVLVGIIVEFVALRPVRRGAFLAPLITSIGASIVIENAVVRILGSQSQPFAAGLSTGTVRAGDIQLPTLQVVLFLLAILLVIAVRVVIDRTSYGRSLRATAEDPSVAPVLGINVNRVILLTIIIGSALAGIAGASIGAAYNTVSPFMGLSFGLKGLVVMIVGGVGRLTGAAAAGILLGIVEALAVGFVGSTYRDAVAFAMVLIVLLLRPQGLFGTSLSALRT